ncbi:hypothetical protein DFS33DRAFT_1490575 [Desarmillaria ectypa]|nr:hypothetical protein DFS33DRAFT_1490575 [Desarmillaria ectypa]
MGHAAVICSILKSDKRSASVELDMRLQAESSADQAFQDRWAPFARDLYHPSTMLLSLPSEILENIAFEADNRTHRQLRRTCKLLRDIATPLVFQSIHIDLSWTRHSSSAPWFLESLKSGPKLAQHITRLSLYLPQKFRSNPSRFANEARIKKREDKLDSLDALFLEAIPHMVSLRSLSWRSSGDSGPSYAKLMFERFGNLPFISNLEICNFGDWDVPYSPFRHIRNLNYRGSEKPHFITLLSNNTEMESLDLAVWYSNFEEGQSISVLFSSLPPGTCGTLKTFQIIGSTYTKLYTHEIPGLIRHLHSLENLYTHISLPNEFWDRLCEDEIHLVSLSYFPNRIERALMLYLMSYTGLCELSLCTRARSTPDDFHIQDLLLNIIALHSWCLTTVRIEPSYSGAWCLDHPMLDALTLCSGLESLCVRADKARTLVEANNVVDRALESLIMSWPNLWELKIYAVSRALGFDAVRATASQIHKRILAFRFAQPAQGKPKRYLSSDFATYSIKICNREQNSCAFKVEYLKYHGKKELWRKYKFWKRSGDTNDD